MTGRGSGRLICTSQNPSVTIGLTLSTSPPTLSPSPTEPFYIIVTARILSTPNPDRPITLQTHPSPLDALTNRSFYNITCTTNPDKKIEIFPRGWPQYHWDTQDLRSAWSFVTIPLYGQGTYSARLEVPRHRIEAANLKKGERYRVSLTDKCLGTRWWSFASLDDLEGVRLRTWRSRAEEEAEEAEIEGSGPEYREEIEREHREKYGTGPVTMGEDPWMLAMVAVCGQVEFEVG